MKKTAALLAAAILTAGSMLATPRVININNHRGKTTVKLLIPASDRTDNNSLSISNIRLYNDGKTYKPKDVDADWNPDAVITLKFKKITTFDDPVLIMTLNGEEVRIPVLGEEVKKLEIP